MAENNSSSENSRSFFQIPQNLSERISLNGNLPYNVGQTVSGLVPRIVSSASNPQQQRQTANGSGHAATQGQQLGSPISEPSVVLNIGSDNPYLHQLSNVGALHHVAHGNHGHTHHVHMPDENQNEDEDGTHNHGQQDNRIDYKLLLLNSGIFVVILFMRLVSEHVLGLLVFIGLGGTFFYANLTLQRAIHQSSLRDSNNGKNLLTFLWITVFLSANISCVFYVFRDQELWNILMFTLPSVWNADIWMFLWVVVVVDFMIKFVTMIIKALLAVLPIRQKKRGKLYMCVEHVMQLYRMLIPIIPWYHFLSDGQTWLFAGFLTLTYSLFKINQIFVKFLDVKNALQRLSVDVIYGVRPSSSDLKTTDESLCPICQDEYKDPVMLNCKHIFCENCVSVWFDREKTCPMCRAQIHTESPLWKDGATSVHIQWY